MRQARRGPWTRTQFCSQPQEAGFTVFAQVVVDIPQPGFGDMEEGSASSARSPLQDRVSHQPLT